MRRRVSPIILITLCACEYSEYPVISDLGGGPRLDGSDWVNRKRYLRKTGAMCKWRSEEQCRCRLYFHDDQHTHTLPSPHLPGSSPDTSMWSNNLCLASSRSPSVTELRTLMVSGGLTMDMPFYVAVQLYCKS